MNMVHGIMIGVFFSLIIISFLKGLLLRTCFTGKPQSWALQTALMLVEFSLLLSIFHQITHLSHPRCVVISELMLYNYLFFIVLFRLFFQLGPVPI